MGYPVSAVDHFCHDLMSSWPLVTFLMSALTECLCSQDSLLVLQSSVRLNLQATFQPIYNFACKEVMAISLYSNSNMAVFSITFSIRMEMTGLLYSKIPQNNNSKAK